MDKKNAMRRAKRQSKVLEDNFWDCSVCTYRNTAEAFKCLMCDVRKGTSTRKPRLNQAMVAQQVGAAVGGSGNTGGGTSAGGDTRTSSSNNKKSKGQGGGGGGGGKGLGGLRSEGKRGRRVPPRLSNIDRSSAQAREVTVNSVTVVITEYKRRVPQHHNNTSENEEDSDTRP